MPIYPTKEARALKFKGSPLFPSAQDGASDAQTTRFVAEPAKQERGLKFTNRADSNLSGARQIQKDPGYVMTGKEKRAMKKPEPAGSGEIQIDDPYSFDPYQWTNDSVKKDLGEIFVNTFGEDAEMESLTAEQRIGLQQNIEHVRQKRLKRALDARNVALKKVEADAKKATAGAGKGTLTEYQKHQIAKDRATREIVPEGAWASVKQTDWDEYDRLRAMKNGGARAGGGTGGKYGFGPDGKRVKGQGFLGELKMKDGSDKVATEMSIGITIDGKQTEIPLIVPTLDKKELDHALTGKKPTEAMVKKAAEHAKQRIAKGLSPFAQPDETIAKGGAAGNKTVREPHESEKKYFRKNPNVKGMATEDGKVILNPYAKMTDVEKKSVVANESIRLKMLEKKIVPNINITDEQKKFFGGTEYGKPGNETYLKQTIIARILSGDPSAKATDEQKLEAQKIASGLGLSAGNKTAPKRRPLSDFGG